MKNGTGKRGKHCGRTRETIDRSFLPSLSGLYRNLRIILTEPTFGLLRWTRIVITCIQFADPFMWLCHLADLLSERAGKLFTEFFVRLKLIFPILLLSLACTNSTVLRVVCLYIVFETLLYVWSTVLSGSNIDEPASYHRSLLLLVIGFFAVNISFSWLYYSAALIKGVENPLDAVYFSLVTAATIGYGDKVPYGSPGQILVIMQIFSSLSYLTVFFAHHIGNLHKDEEAS